MDSLSVDSVSGEKLQENIGIYDNKDKIVKFTFTSLMLF